MSSRLIVLLSGTALSIMPALAHAQAVTASAPQDGAAGLEDIVVTAQRREENLQRAAVSVTVLSGENLTTRGVTTAAALTQVAPALQVTAGTGPYTVLTVRGVSNFGGNAFSDPAIAVNFSGVYLASPTAVQGLFYDLERVEVLKGPQGTLYGRNATGGAINILPQHARIGERGAQLNFEVGNYARVAASGAVNLPVGENSAFRAAFQILQRDGFFSDGLDDERGQAVRLSYRLQPSSAVTIDIVGDYTHQGGRGGGSTVRKRCGPDICYFGDPRTSLSQQDAAFAPLARQTDNSFIDSDYYGLLANVNVETDAGTLTLIPAYRTSRLSYNSAQTGFQIIEQQQPEQISMEARLASPSGNRFGWLIGAYYLDTHVTARSNTESAAALTYSDQIIDTSGKTAAGFGQLTFAIVPAFRVTGGLRYTWERKTSDSERYTIRNAPGPDPVIPLLPVGAPAFVVDRSLTFEAVTWRAGLEFDAGPRSLVYANVGTGFKAGGFFLGPPGANSFEPEKVTAYTIGTKNRFLDNRLQLNVEAFLLDYKDQQLGYVKLIPPSVVLVTENIGQVRTKGVEAEAELLVTPSTRIGLQAQWLDARVKKLVYNSVSTPGPTSQCRTAGTTVDCSALRALKSPEWVVAASLEQSFTLGSGDRIIANIFSRYEGPRELDLAYTPETRVGGSTRTDAVLTYAFEGKGLSISAFVNNIEDDVVVNNVAPNPAYSTIGVVATSLRPPRTYGVRLSGTF
ncbi:iron complex outermembrane receptor protein [Sphingobium sp. B2D3A]|uniref:TonB-dependent receptor n=1 Tax=unclassified Sphingobium TaxID=2611147 RepID=UPI0022244EE2|nr:MULTISPECIES: TonB-dependent receptor [unclassified Sphingobium]MCW2335972.1 iron complex outermembrane receptor protein [Sphingobium sp. B2D3A]MCW2385731.1 iron complex outermembrane receptor protein [Sphingobium sp. B2D3D]